ncbi:Adrenodoxin-like protein 1, mitochondrial [Gracilariopsis chorda]|uniref:Adrenodoxin-like protein 1, mitochondrial n=1 Tax=Gracilariopsis chorda TaxID=448386 RepID=A0A2V3IWT5_9FLOR|nr:Adrenodoxin-like protein 1, mitochondrial [Gracilariopsis chorda]|eukprot:PXF46157.1 Adrenodoxin-like protein 1, mitochondrial [Gracilariopsis chorda]
MLRQALLRTLRRARATAAPRVTGARSIAAARRGVHCSPPAAHGYDPRRVDPSTAIALTFVDRDGARHALKAPPGASLLEVAHANHIDLEGACEGSLACSTCHVYLDQPSFDLLAEPCDDENDMLDLAFALTELSRLGCQVKMNPQLEGMQVTLPPATRNMAVDGFVPQPH